VRAYESATDNRSRPPSLFLDSGALQYSTVLEKTPPHKTTTKDLPRRITRM